MTLQTDIDLSAPQRLFIALPVPDAARSDLEPQVASLRAECGSGSVRWIKPVHWHLTLRFLGRTQRGEKIERAIPTTAECVSARALALGPFPRRRPSVLAATLAPDPALQKLAHQVESMACELGFRPENRRFRAHVSVARIKRGTTLDWPSRALDGVWRFETLGLYRSDLTPTGAQYTIVRRWTLSP